MVSEGPAGEAKAPYELVEPARRRRLIRVVLRSTLSIVVLVILYYTLPMTGRIDSSALARLVVGLLVLAVVLTLQVRAIASSAYPQLNAVETLAIALPLLLLIFASTYLLLDRAQTGAFSESLNRTGALYFTVTVFSTVGFGDIVPKTDTARVVTMVQMLVDLAVLGLVARLIVQAVELGKERQSARAAGGNGPAG
jgi:voltage-gated potassium channel